MLFVVKFIVLFILFYLSYCDNNIYYISSYNGDNTNDCSVYSPCSSIMYILNNFNNTNNLIINIYSGDYNQQDNLNINFGLINNITIQQYPLNNNNEVSFYCNNDNNNVFTTSYNLNINGISFYNCDKAIIINSDNTTSSQTNIQNSYFNNCTYSIFIDYGDLIMINTSIYGEGISTGISIFYSSNIYIDGGEFISLGTSFIIGNMNDNGIISIQNCDFQYSGEITIISDYFITGRFTNINFSYPALFVCFSLLSDANWEFNNCFISSDESGIVISGSGYISIDNSIFDINNNALTIDFEGDISISHSSINMGVININLEGISHLLLEDNNFININSPFRLIGNINTSGSINRCNFTNPSNQVLVLKGEGSFWSLNDIIITEGNNLHSLSGGLLQLDCELTSNTICSTFMIVEISNSILSSGTTSSKGGAIYSHKTNLQITNTSIKDNIGSIGGGLYCDSYEYINIENSIFQSNDATNYGGAIYLQGLSNNNIPGTVYISNVTFSENTAQTGAILACCKDTSLPTCNTDIVYSLDTIIIDNNLNTDPEGNDIYCNTEYIYSEYTSSYYLNNNISSTSNNTWIWILLIIVIILIIIILGISGIIYYLINKYYINKKEQEIEYEEGYFIDELDEFDDFD